MVIWWQPTFNKLTHSTCQSLSGLASFSRSDSTPPLPSLLHQRPSTGRDLLAITQLLHGNRDCNRGLLKLRPVTFPLVLVPVSSDEKYVPPGCHQVSRKCHLVKRTLLFSCTRVIPQGTVGRAGGSRAWLLQALVSLPGTHTLTAPPTAYSRQTVLIDFSTVPAKCGPCNLIQYWS